MACWASLALGNARSQKGSIGRLPLMSVEPDPDVSSSELEPTLDAPPPAPELMETRLADVASGCKEDALAHAAATRSCPDRPARALPGMKPGQHVHDFELLRLLGEGSF